MKKLTLLFFSCLSIFFLMVNQTEAQQPKNRLKTDSRNDTKLMAEINKIKIFDNHAHPISAGTTSEVEDVECDPLNFVEVEQFVGPTRLRPDNLEYVGAWQLLYGYKHNDMTEQHVAELGKQKQHIIAEKGEAYPSWVLDQIGVETMLCNRIKMGRGLSQPHFRWITFVDPLLFPLNNVALSKVSPDAEKFFISEEKLFKRYLGELQISTLPVNLNDYLKRVVTALMEKRKQEGIVAVKFQVAYLRPLDFGLVSEADAARIYSQYIKGGQPSAAEYKQLQDFLFRYIAREAGRLNLPVNIHSGAGGGGYFNCAGSNPLLLESVFNDPTLRKTNFVLVHGGWPFIKETTFLLSKPNVYVDFSVLQFLSSTRLLSETLRSWLDFAPEKILFGSDAFSITPEVNWEEMSWLAVQTGRQALAMTLKAMIDEGQITRAQAIEIARMVLRENGMTLYGFKKPA